MKADRLWHIAALVLAVAAAAASLHTWLSAPRHAEILRRKESDLRQIEAHANRWAREDAYRGFLDAQQAWQPVRLEEIAIRTLGMDVARVVPRPAAPAADGWQRREVSVEIPSVSYAEAVLFLAAAAESLPAWRLREIDLRPSAEAGTGAMTAVLEALEKKQP
jgi:hypothetical protein